MSAFSGPPLWDLKTARLLQRDFKTSVLYCSLLLSFALRCPSLECLGLRYNAVARVASKYLYERLGSNSWQLAHWLPFSMAIPAFLGLPNFLFHPATMRAKSARTLKICFRSTTASKVAHTNRRDAVEI